MNFIIGSGPAGIAAALALTEKGQAVTMIDVGLQLEPERQQNLERLRAQSPSQWPSDILQSFRENTDARVEGVPLKHVYGSTYHIRGTDQMILCESEKFKILCSLAEGGLSSVWGAAVLPYTDEDLKSWPIGVKELATHYQRILSVMPLSARKDRLEARYPLYSDTLSSLKMSRQAKAFCEDMEQNRPGLERDGFQFGAARLAVRAPTNNQGPGCVYCGMCLYGCPYGLIYNSQQTLAHLQKNKLFTYRSGILVDRVIEQGSEVEIQGRTYPGGSMSRFRGSRVFLACGVLSTARIMLASMPGDDTELRVRSSQHFILPLLRMRSILTVTKEELHTLAQLFIEYIDPRSSRENIHFQAYSFNDLYVRALRKLMGPVYPLCSPWIDRFLLGRLLILQGYLHSDYSPVLKVRLDRSTGRIRVIPEAHPDARSKIRAVARLFQKNKSLFKAWPVTPLLKISGEGIGAHVGGSFPMRKKPGRLETDLLGVPLGFSRVHLVDASGFPDIPPTTITLTIMANAHRIASLTTQNHAN